MVNWLCWLRLPVGQYRYSLGRCILLRRMNPLGSVLCGRRFSGRNRPMWPVRITARCTASYRWSHIAPRQSSVPLGSNFTTSAASKHDCNARFGTHNRSSSRNNRLGWIGQAIKSLPPQNRKTCKTMRVTMHSMNTEKAFWEKSLFVWSTLMCWSLPY